MKFGIAVKAMVIVAMSIVCVFGLACGSSPSTPPAPVMSVAKTQNPLVANATVTMACSGQAMVEFGPDINYGRSTAWSPPAGTFRQASILVAGMKPSTTYHMRAQVQCGGNNSTSVDQTFTTGPLPTSTASFPTFTVIRPNPSLSSQESPGIELFDAIDLYLPATTDLIQAMFLDRDGNPIWYYDVGAGSYPYTMKPLYNGHILFSITQPNVPTLLREVDLAGNTVREMNIPDLAAKMQVAGFDFVPISFHHDLLPLANGHVIVLANFPKDYENLAGYPGTTQVIGDGIIDLDENWNPVWAWNSFDHLNVNRHLFGLPDWTHGNALVYSPSDGDLIFSMRNQSTIIKIDYKNGVGTGNVLWYLGYQGGDLAANGTGNTFSLNNNGVPSDDPSLWFSAQHFPSIIGQSLPQTTLAVWDNGDNRVIDAAGEICGSSPLFLPCFSRATIFNLDETVMTADLQWVDSPNAYGLWGGSIDQLANGNIEFDVNALTPPLNPNEASLVEEVTQTSSPQVIWEMQIPIPFYAYRAYRVPSLYPGVIWTH